MRGRYITIYRTYKAQSAEGAHCECERGRGSHAKTMCAHAHCSKSRMRERLVVVRTCTSEPRVHLLPFLQTHRERARVVDNIVSCAGRLS